jgi:hypothetical protein
VLLFRDGGLPLSTSDVGALVDFFSELLDEFGDGSVPVMTPALRTWRERHMQVNGFCRSE